jgi:hypothetical protein
VILSGKTQSIEDAFNDANYNRDFAVAGNWRRLIGAPMLKDGAPVGAILVAGPTPARRRSARPTCSRPSPTRP